jgi:hypothetical protein
VKELGALVEATVAAQIEKRASGVTVIKKHQEGSSMTAHKALATGHRALARAERLAAKHEAATNPTLAKIRGAKADAHDAMANAHDQLDGQSPTVNGADKVNKSDAVVSEFMDELRLEGGIFAPVNPYDRML